MIANATEINRLYLSVRQRIAASESVLQSIDFSDEITESDSFALLNHLQGAAAAAQSLQRLVVGCEIPKKGD